MYCELSYNMAPKTKLGNFKEYRNIRPRLEILFRQKRITIVKTENKKSAFIRR